MVLPRKLKYLNMFNDGLSYMGIVESVTLPKLTRKLEKYRGGGIRQIRQIGVGDALAQGQVLQRRDRGVVVINIQLPDFEGRGLVRFRVIPAGAVNDIPAAPLR